MKLRIIADIHIDINKAKNYQFNFGDDFIVACGDISGDRFTTENWIKKNIKNILIKKLLLLRIMPQAKIALVKNIKAICLALLLLVIWIG